jgi:hypothetical protein
MSMQPHQVGLFIIIRILVRLGVGLPHTLPVYCGTPLRRVVQVNISMQLLKVLLFISTIIMEALVHGLYHTVRR